MPNYAVQWDRIVVTVNNWRQSDYDHLVEMWGNDWFTYMIIGKEGNTPGPNGEARTPHLQCFMILQRKKTCGVIIKKLTFADGRKAFVERANGPSPAAADYCKKEGDFEEWGECRPAAGAAGGESQKDKWAYIAEKADEYDTYEEFFDWINKNYPEIAINMVDKLERYHARLSRKKVPRVLETVELEWFQGVSGSGKSHTARAENPGAFVKLMSGKWFDGYDNHKVLIIDDLDMFNIKNQSDSIKQLCDKYALDVEIKGSVKLIRPTKIIVTSQYPIDRVFAMYGNEFILAMKRRFKMRMFTTPYVAPDAVPANTTEPDESSDEDEVVIVNDNAQVPVPPNNLW